MHDSMLLKLDRYFPYFIFPAALIVVPLLFSLGAIRIETVNLLGRYTCFAIVALGLGLVWGYCGILSLCQSLFFCLGAYCMGMYLAMQGPLDGANIPRCLYVVTSEVKDFQLPLIWWPFSSFSIALLLGLLVPALVAWLIAFSAFRSRVKGVYFSIITQALTLAAYLVFCRNDLRLCGTNGLTNFTNMLSFDLTDNKVKVGLYILTVLTLAALYFVSRFLVEARIGRILIAIRDNENRLRFSGYKPLSFKVFIFVLGAFFAGIGGMLYSPQMGIVTPTHMNVDRSILIVVWVAVGGRQYLSGAIFGAYLVNFAYSIFTSTCPEYWPFFLGVLFLAVVMVLPNGLIGLWKKSIASLSGKVIVVAPNAEPEITQTKLPVQTIK